VHPGESWRAHRSLMIFTGERGDPAAMEVTYTFHGIIKRNGRSEAVIRIFGMAQDRLDGVLEVKGQLRGTAYLDLEAAQISLADARAEMYMGDDTGKKMITALTSKMERSLGKEVLKVRGELSAKSQRDPQNHFLVPHVVQLQAGKPVIVSLESPKGPGYFDTLVRVEDANGKMIAQDDDSGVDLNSLISFTPAQTGAYRIVVTSFQAGVTGNYLLVVRQ
jgi:hypothetical protein